MVEGVALAAAEASDRAESRRYGDEAVPEVSVVTATHGRAGYLPAFLDALAAQSVGLDRFEVVVVDDASDDDTWQALLAAADRTDLRLLCVRLARNVGSGAARTLGLGCCRGAVVAFTDDDCLPTPQWLAHLCAPLEGPSGEAASVVVQGRTTPWPEDQAAGGPWARTLWVLEPTWLFETCNIAYRRVDLEAVGGFPSAGETPPVPSGRQVGEDAITGWRVVERGGRLVFAHEALVFHRNVPASFGQWIADQRGKAVFPALAARHALARRAFWARWFLTPRSAAVVVSILSVGALAVSRRPGWGAGLVPWVVLALPEARSRPGRPLVVRLAQVGLADVAGLAATAGASIRHRTLVL